MFDFSRAEAEVAIALTGGASAEDVARRRGVSLMTVRSQIRAILGKAEAENLRDFERTMATVAALAAPVQLALPAGRLVSLVIERSRRSSRAVSVITSGDEQQRAAG